MRGGRGAACASRWWTADGDRVALLDVDGLLAAEPDRERRAASCSAARLRAIENRLGALIAEARQRRDEAARELGAGVARGAPGAAPRASTWRPSPAAAAGLLDGRRRRGGPRPRPAGPRRPRRARWRRSTPPTCRASCARRTSRTTCRPARRRGRREPHPASCSARRAAAAPAGVGPRGPGRLRGGAARAPGLALAPRRRLAAAAASRPAGWPTPRWPAAHGVAARGARWPSPRGSRACWRLPDPEPRRRGRAAPCACSAARAAAARRRRTAAGRGDEDGCCRAPSACDVAAPSLRAGRRARGARAPPTTLRGARPGRGPARATCARRYGERWFAEPRGRRLPARALARGRRPRPRRSSPASWAPPGLDPGALIAGGAERPA